MSRFVSVNLSIIVNLAFLLNLWPSFWKSLSANIVLESFTSFLWLFSYSIWCWMVLLIYILQGYYRSFLSRAGETTFWCILRLTNILIIITPWGKSLAGLQANVGSGRLQVVYIKAILANSVQRTKFVKVCLSQVKFNFSIENFFFQIVSWHQNRLICKLNLI